MRNDDDDIDRMDVPAGDVDDEAKPEAETDFPIEGEAAGSGTGLTRDEVALELSWRRRMRTCERRRLF